MYNNIIRQLPIGRNHYVLRGNFIERKEKKKRNDGSLYESYFNSVFAYIKFLRNVSPCYEPPASFDLHWSTSKKKKKKRKETCSSSSLSLVRNKCQLIEQNFTTYRNENDTYSVCNVTICIVNSGRNSRYLTSDAATRRKQRRRGWYWSIAGHRFVACKS